MYNWSGESLHRELELWVEGSGVSPLRTLEAATGDNAKILKIDDRTGSIQEGLDISDTRNIRYVFTNGKLVDRESFGPSVEELNDPEDQGQSYRPYRQARAEGAAEWW